MKQRLRALAIVGALLGTTLGAQQSSTPSSADEAAQPRFRGGANLVRVDAYVTADGVPVTDLTAQDFEVLEDNVPQRVESFRLVDGRDTQQVATPREPNSVDESREMARDPNTRLFVLFMDLWHVQVEGSYRAQGPISNALDRVVGRGDLVGVMHPDMAARSMTFTRRADSITTILKDHWYWGERGKLNSSDPREEEIRQCYPDSDDTVGIAEEMIRRRRESKTLNALEALVIHLEGVREDRKFVFLLTEGWLLRGPDQALARTLRTPGGSSIPTPPPVGVDPQGRLRVDPRDQGDSNGSCERERSMLAFSDHRTQFDQLIQRANRANVSFYPIDPRGPVAFDEPINSSRALTTQGPNAGPVADAARLGSRRDAVRVLAANTDGFAIVDTNSIDSQLQRILQDTGSYYLLGYYSTNTKLDGRFRRLTVRVKRPDVEVRARPGYLAPTEAELASTRVEALMNGAPPGHTTIPPSIVRAFAGLPSTRRTMPLWLHTAASPSQIWITGELDAAVAKNPEWQKGGRIRALFEHETGATPSAQSELTWSAGQRAFQVSAPADLHLAPGRYVVRIELLPESGTLPLQTTADVIVPEGEWLVSPSALASRRGPSTGLQYVATADTRFRRTERIRLNIPRSSSNGKVSAQVLGRDGQPLNVAIVLSERSEGDQQIIVADVTLAPLAQGDYAVEIVVDAGERKESSTFAFRVIP
jgi:VWFA-related protein